MPENLRELLGDDFPEEKIRAIIKEADLTEDNQISYPEFLALWEEGSPTTGTQGGLPGSISPSESQSSLVGQPETVEKRNLRADSEAESASLARANFVEGKKLSVRKALDVQHLDVQQAPLVILNEMEEIVEDPAREVEYTDDLVCQDFRGVPPEITKLDSCFTFSEISRGSMGGDSTVSTDSRLPNANDPIQVPVFADI